MRIGIGIAQEGLALRTRRGVSTLATMARAWRKTGTTRVLAAIDARMGESVLGGTTSVMRRASGRAKRQAVLKPEQVIERLAQLSGSGRP